MTCRQILNGHHGSRRSLSAAHSIPRYHSPGRTAICPGPLISHAISWASRRLPFPSSCLIGTSTDFVSVKK
ncbi:hypothetical protein I7I48_06778 [Histoplasma ohiense]|nr:hypothetical protein I7I48_06778 [Histoplasma ohiense (nom. inval.)]